MKKLSWRFNPPSFRRKKRRQRRKVNTVRSPKPAWNATVTKEAQCFDDSLRKKEIFLPGGSLRDEVYSSVFEYSLKCISHTHTHLDDRHILGYVQIIS